jgi:hypothetical protein
MALEKGNEGEKAIIKILHDLGYTIRRPDLVFFEPRQREWFMVEVKNKEPFTPPPAYMQGIPRSQYEKDMKIYNETKLRTLLVVRGKDNEWLGQFIDELEPVPDPRPHCFNDDVLVWFNLDTFQPLFKIVTILPPHGNPLPFK